MFREGVREIGGGSCMPALAHSNKNPGKHYEQEIRKKAFQTIGGRIEKTSWEKLAPI
ncbi:hypothetical protein HCH_03915 [Hahella chejuensis KCTC 2396]|uniref:Uncharacterized protein n=1 Tax=Hahella chejuensis (strain KCTC 2396) TaxID=349521 RepID=Q2SFD7_HAHCH|nr:hypothetical protein HCH_03915 [Hahella chejuensis KCTC 2396]